MTAREWYARLRHVLATHQQETWQHATVWLLNGEGFWSCDAVGLEENALRFYSPLNANHVPLRIKDLVQQVEMLELKVDMDADVAYYAHHAWHTIGEIDFIHTLQATEWQLWMMST